ncbi:MAG TPA: CpsD/CapB family tyrosine-protein kinase [Terriglobales bacterium]|nr:CpsD/CapB family tyrosine-protein kinase [Terriglobales bacterium]
MSRIHDALKRAEQERATSLGGNTEPAIGQPELQPVNAPERTHAHTAVMPAAAFSYESLLARCPVATWSPDERTMLFFQDDENRKGAEEFRTLRSRLYQIREKISLKRLMVTSALPKEGKSFVAANLAQVIVRQQGRRVLLIDADLRSPGMHRHLGASQTPGLSDYLRGEADEFSVIQRSPMDNLFFLPAGRQSSGAPELLANGRLKLLMQRVEPMFDWIIMDTPPVIPVADSTLLANFCEGVLMVVRSNSTPSDLARKAREEFQDKLLLGVVLNGIPADQLPQSRYYYGEAVSSPA